MSTLLSLISDKNKKVISDRDSYYRSKADFYASVVNAILTFDINSLSLSAIDPSYVSNKFIRNYDDDVCHCKCNAGDFGWFGDDTDINDCDNCNCGKISSEEYNLKYGTSLLYANRFISINISDILYGLFRDIIIKDQLNNECEAVTEIIYKNNIATLITINLGRHGIFDKVTQSIKIIKVPRTLRTRIIIKIDKKFIEHNDQFDQHPIANKMITKYIHNITGKNNYEYDSGKLTVKLASISL